MTVPLVFIFLTGRALIITLFGVILIHFLSVNGELYKSSFLIYISTAVEL